MGQIDINDLVSSLQKKIAFSTRSAEDFKIFFTSSYNHYDALLPSYVRRNISFLLDSLFITASHAKDPLKNPTGFGLALGGFIMLSEKLKYPEITKALFSNTQATKFFRNTLVILLNTDLVDKQVFRTLFEDINTTLLEGEELKNYSESITF